MHKTKSVKKLPPKPVMTWFLAGMLALGALLSPNAAPLAAAQTPQPAAEAVVAEAVVAEESRAGSDSRQPDKSGFPFAIRALAAALAIGLSALATGFAQARIGAAGMGTMAEKPELAGRVILLVALPETLVILGFVIATLIIL